MPNYKSGLGRCLSKINIKHSALVTHEIVCYARTRRRSLGTAHMHTHAHAAVRFSKLSAAERERGRRGGESSSPTDPQSRERQRLEQELGGEITAVLKKYFIAELQQFIGSATSSP